MCLRYMVRKDKAMLKQMLTPKEVAEYLSIGLTAAYELMHNVDFPSFRVAYGKGRGVWRVNLTDLDKWINQQKRKKPMH